MITAHDRMLLGRARWTPEELVRIAFMARGLVATLDALLGVRLVQVPILPGDDQRGGGADQSEPNNLEALATKSPHFPITSSTALPIPRRVASALRAVDSLRTHAELELVAARLRERLEAA